MSETVPSVSVIFNYTRPITWSVEAINTDGDGGVDVTIFSGPDAYYRAIEYAKWKYNAP